jgi:predicted transcriptional regulator
MDFRYHLKKFYDNLSGNLLLDKKLKNNSILLTFLELKSNVRYRAISSASISSQNIPDLIISELLKNKFIRQSDELNKYVITAKGVWFIEKNTNIITEEAFIDFIDGKLFDVSLSGSDLSDKEKVILFSMISARALSEKSPIDLKKDQYALDAWKKIIDDCYKKLYEIKAIKKMDQEQLYGKKGNEHMVSNLIRHTDSLPKKTMGIFKSIGQQKYYLDIYKDQKLSKDSLLYIFRLILNSANGLDARSIEDINKFCNDIAYGQAPYIYDVEKHKFSSPDYDDIIKDIIREVILA